MCGSHNQPLKNIRTTSYKFSHFHLKKFVSLNIQKKSGELFTFYPQSINRQNTTFRRLNTRLRRLSGRKQSIEE